MNLKLDYYNTRCLSLAKSIVLKSDMLAIETEARLDPTMGFINKSRTEWKYYKTLAGIYHETNEEMSVISLDTLETIKFTKDVLEIHTVTKEVYSSFGTEYDSLVKRYPENVALIHGIIYNRSIEDVIDLPDYTIVGYNQNLVESNEYDLIPRLNKRLNQLGMRTGNADYALVERGYATYHMFLISSKIKDIIKLVRFSNINLTRAHSFYIWSKINNFIPLEQFKANLNDSEIIFLYKNIERLANGRGGNKVINEIIDKFLTPRNLKTYQLGISLDTKTLNEIEVDKTYLFNETPLNGGVKRAVIKELFIAEHIERSLTKRDNYDAELTQLLKSKVDINPTREIRIIAEESTGRALRTFITNVDYNMQFLQQDLITRMYSITNVVSGDVYTLTFRESLVLFLRLLQIWNETESEFIPTYYTNQISSLEKRPTEEELIKDWFISPVIASKIVKALPDFPKEKNNMVALDSFTNNFSDGIVQLRTLIVQAMHGKNRTFIERLLSRYVTMERIPLMGSSAVKYEDWLKLKSIDLTILNKHDLELTITTLMKDVLRVGGGIQNNNLTAMTALLKEFISYQINLSNESVPVGLLSYTVVPPLVNNLILDSVNVNYDLVGVNINGNVTVKHQSETNYVGDGITVRSTIRDEVTIKYHSVCIRPKPLRINRNYVNYELPFSNKEE